MALATHAVIGEKQARALEPLLATPLSTLELLAAKTLTRWCSPWCSTGISIGLYIAGIVVVGEPGCGRPWLAAHAGDVRRARSLVGLAALQLAVIVSSRANESPVAQQLASLMIPADYGAVRGPDARRLCDCTPALVLGLPGLRGAERAAAWVGIRVFDRETILMRWK